MTTAALNQFQQKLDSEKKKGVSKAFLINFSITYYALFALQYLFSKGLGIELFGGLSSGFLLAILPISIGAAFVWTKSTWSPGRTMIEKTHPMLKGLRKKYDGNWLTTPSGLITLGTIGLTLGLGWMLTSVNLYDLFSMQGVQGAKRIFASLLTPELAIIDVVLEAMVETIFIAFMATALSIPVAFLVSFLCARNLMKHSNRTLAVYNFFRSIFNFTRSVEPLIWAIIFSVWVGIGPFAGMLALMIHTVAALAKLYSEQVECIDHGPVEAIEATGANRLQVIAYAIVPQIVLPYLSFTIYRWDINIRMATIIGLVGGGGVGTLLMQYQGLAKWNEVGTIIIVIAIVVWAMDVLSAKIREAIA